MNDKTYYLCGPMSGIDDYNIPAFTAAARQLRNQGLTVVVPCEITANMTTEQLAQWNLCMRADITELVKCDGIILLPGWSKSNGAKAELAIALSLGFDVLFYHEDASDRLINMERA